MREIKFRAWHPSLKKMFYDCRVTSSSWTDSSTHFGGEHDTLMQYTGLKDKSGKEIYEGDILKRSRYYKVLWLNSGWHLNSHNKITAFPIERYVPSEYEVIGNIYENEDLL